MALANRSLSIEFVVIPREDLYLEGGIRKLVRVAKGVAYPCQMLKSQNFNCLFRHYAKHNGLRKEDLVFHFVDELQPEQMPESVHLMGQDEIWVSHRKFVEVEKTIETTNSYPEQFLNMLKSGNHSDITFLIGDDKEPIRAHKAVITARSEYFQAMFREGVMAESTQDSVEFALFKKKPFEQMLEYLYTNLISGLDTATAEDLLNLLDISNQLVMNDLNSVCGFAASKVLQDENIVQFMHATQAMENPCLRDACIKFVRQQKSQLRQNEEFCSELRSAPDLGMLLFDAMQDSQDEGCSMPGNKRCRVSEASPPAHEMIPVAPGGANTIMGHLNGGGGFDMVP